MQCFMVAVFVVSLVVIQFDVLTLSVINVCWNFWCLAVNKELVDLKASLDEHVYLVAFRGKEKTLGGKKNGVQFNVWMAQ